MLLHHVRLTSEMASTMILGGTKDIWSFFLCLCFATKSSAKTDKIKDSNLKVEESTDVMDIFKPITEASL